MRSFVPVQPPLLEYGVLHKHYRYNEYAPDERLRDVVCCYWSSAAEPQQDCQWHRIVPDGCIDIIFDLDAREMKGAFLSQLMMSYDVMPLYEPMAFFGIRMYASQLRRLFGYAGAALTGYHVGLESWLGHDATVITEQVITANDLAERMQIVDTWLLHLLYQRDDPTSSLWHTVVQEIHDRRGHVSIRQLATDTYYSERTLRRLFQQELGISPKEWADIVRFQAFLRYWQMQPQLPLSKLATAFGYYDQAHLNLAFHRYYGLTPGQLRLRQMYVD